MEKGFDRGKNRISLYFLRSPDCFPGSPDFPLPGVGKSVILNSTSQNDQADNFQKKRESVGDLVTMPH